jgi:hypothetical protein
LLELAIAGTFNASRHGDLLASDDSVLEAAAAAPGDRWLGVFAEWCLIYRGEHPTAVSWLAGSRKAAQEFGFFVRKRREEVAGGR